MAKLVPELSHTDILTLDPGKQALLNALMDTLDDDWTIFVRPFLNGIEPDILIFSPQAGIGLFEVSDLDLTQYRVSPLGYWERKVAAEAQDKAAEAAEHWQLADISCPLAAAQRIKDNITTYELPELDAEIILDSRYYALLSTMVYFHNHTTQEATTATGPLREDYPFTAVFGYDWLAPNKISRMLHQQRLQKSLRFSAIIQDMDLENRLYNAIARPQYGRLDDQNILFELSAEQKRLMSFEPGTKRVLGSAGSGKSIVLVRKAVAAAKMGKKVLVVCYNITMTNYLNEIIRHLAHHEDPTSEDISRRIFVRHFHRMFPGGWELEDPEVARAAPFDVVLVDEGQDFDTKWIGLVFSLADQTNGHVMFVEDDRQNIYGKDLRAKRRVPGIIGRPALLKGTFRLNRDVVGVANRLVALSGQTYESDDMESIGPHQIAMFPPKWVEGAEPYLLAALAAEVQRLVEGPTPSAPADIVILVCNYVDGWKVCDQLDGLQYPYTCNFETRDERKRLERQYAGPRLGLRLNDLRRARKMAFWMRAGRIKVCTIHSFKGWELRHVLVFFRQWFSDEEADRRIPLLYTAITRSQESLSIFNADAPTIRYGQFMGQEILVERRVAKAPILLESKTTAP